ncbi:hypothetical protein Rs2_17611 [Raphanus sativus]|nr:hypothetical protein Rs2_17611 [Raphanus sativus]
MLYFCFILLLAGAGKTLSAKAIAGEAGVPFFSVSGSEFIEMFVGVGASRMRLMLLVGKEEHELVEVSVDVPDIKGITDILKVHAGIKKFENDVSLEVIAMRTPGFSGADIANLLNEATILAGRRAKTVISSKEIDDSVDTFLMCT